MKAPREMFTVGRFGKVHGVAGLIRLYSTTDFPDQYFKPGDFFLDSQGESLPLHLSEIQSQPGKKNFWLVRITGYDGNRVRSLTGCELQLPVTERVKPRGGQFYAGDLVGMAVHDPAGIAVGTVISVDSGIANDVLTIRQDGGGEFAVPFVKAHVMGVNIETGVITIRRTDEVEVR